jgi:hypothetical protein
MIMKSSTDICEDNQNYIFLVLNFEFCFHFFMLTIVRAQWHIQLCQFFFLIILLENLQESRGSICIRDHTVICNRQ